MLLAGGLFEGGFFEETPMSEVPAPEVSSINEQPEAGAVPGTAASDESDEDMGDHFAASPMGGVRYSSFLKNNKILKYAIGKIELSNNSQNVDRTQRNVCLISLSNERILFNKQTYVRPNFGSKCMFVY